MSKKERTSVSVASRAARTLTQPGASRAAKSVAGSALSQRAPSKSSSAGVAKSAARVLGDARSSKISKKIAGSVLAQKPRKSAATNTAKRVLAGSSLAQSVAVRRLSDGTSVRIVLKSISSGSLSQRDVDKAVGRVLAKKKK